MSLLMMMCLLRSYDDAIILKALQTQALSSIIIAVMINIVMSGE